MDVHVYYGRAHELRRLDPFGQGALREHAFHLRVGERDHHRVGVESLASSAYGKTATWTVDDLVHRDAQMDAGTGLFQSTLAPFPVQGPEGHAAPADVGSASVGKQPRL